MVKLFFTLGVYAPTCMHRWRVIIYTSHFCPRFAAGDQLKKYVFITVIVDLFHTKYVLTIFMFLR